MTPRAALMGAMVAALEGAGLRAFDAPPVRGAIPHAVVDEAVLADWSAATWEGREGHVAVRFVDAGERPVRLRDAIELGEAALAELGPALGGGWRVAQMRLQRSRVVRSGERWLGMSEFRVRIYRENG